MRRACYLYFYILLRCCQNNCQLPTFCQYEYCCSYALAVCRLYMRVIDRLPLSGVVMCVMYSDRFGICVIHFFNWWWMYSWIVCKHFPFLSCWQIPSATWGHAVVNNYIIDKSCAVIGSNKVVSPIDFINQFVIFMFKSSYFCWSTLICQTDWSRMYDTNTLSAR